MVKKFTTTVRVSQKTTVRASQKEDRDSERSRERNTGRSHTMPCPISATAGGRPCLAFRTRQTISPKVKADIDPGRKLRCRMTFEYPMQDASRPGRVSIQPMEAQPLSDYGSSMAETPELHCSQTNPIIKIPITALQHGSSPLVCWPWQPSRSWRCSLVIISDVRQISLMMAPAWKLFVLGIRSFF